MTDPIRITVAVLVGAIAAGIGAAVSYGVRIDHIWPGSLVGGAVAALLNLHSTRPRNDRD